MPIAKVKDTTALESERKAACTQSHAVGKVDRDIGLGSQSNLVMDHQDTDTHAVVAQGTIEGNNTGRWSTIELVPLAAVQQAG